MRIGSRPTRKVLIGKDCPPLEHDPTIWNAPANSTLLTRGSQAMTPRSGRPWAGFHRVGRGRQLVSGESVVLVSEPTRDRQHSNLSRHATSGPSPTLAMRSQRYREIFGHSLCISPSGPRLAPSCRQATTDRTHLLFPAIPPV